MIARTWRGEVSECDAGTYLGYLRATGIRDYRVTPGNRGVLTLRRGVGDRVEFFLVSLWDSHEAIRSFAGPAPDTAVFYPEDERYLVARDDHAEHFEVVDASLPSRGLLARLWLRWWTWWWGGWRAFWHEAGGTDGASRPYFIR